MAARPSTLKKTLREIAEGNGYSVSELARLVGCQRSTLREKLDAPDMLLSSLEEILLCMGFNLEVRATTPEGGAFIVKLGAE